MIIYLKGSNSFLGLKTIREIIDKYKLKNNNAYELFVYDSESQFNNFADLTALPLFSTARLFVFKRVSDFSQTIQEQLSHYLSKIPQSTVVVVWDGGDILESLSLILNKAEKIFNVSEPDQKTIRSLAQKEIKKNDWKITDADLEDILNNETDIWQVLSQLKIIALGGELNHQSQTTSTERFIYYRLLRSKDNLAIAQQVRADYQQGKSIDLLIGEITGAIKKEVVDDRKKLTYIDGLISIDFGRKTGQLDDKAVIALISTLLVNDQQKRLQWEKIWQEG